MKTPIQELIETFEQMRHPHLESNVDVGFAISLAKFLLKKEKEVMCEFARCCTSNGSLHDIDDIYNELFNTKEK